MFVERNTKSSRHCWPRRTKNLRVLETLHVSKTIGMNLKQTVPLLLVTDIQRSLEFYRDGLGFPLLRSWELDGQLQWCWLQQGEAALMLQQATDEDPPPATWGKGLTLYFLCDDVDALYSTLAERNVGASQPATSFYGMRQSHVVDPDGYALCFEHPTDD